MTNKNKLRREKKNRHALARNAEVSSHELRNDSNELIAEKLLSGFASVYRFFSQEEHADAMCRGDLFISTLEICRGYEDPRRGDKGEGELTYRMSAQGSSDDQSFVEMARRAGIAIGPSCSNIVINNVRRLSRIPDGLVICTTVRFSPQHMSKSYGKYCVEIHNARLFSGLVDNELKKINGQLLQGMMGLVNYTSRDYSGLQPPPGHPGFVKPKDQYSDDKEYRFLWTHQKNKIFEPIIVRIPRLSEACRRIL